MAGLLTCQTPWYGIRIQALLQSSVQQSLPDYRREDRLWGALPARRLVPACARSGWASLEPRVAFPCTSPAPLSAALPATPCWTTHQSRLAEHRDKVIRSVFNKLFSYVRIARKYSCASQPRVGLQLHFMCSLVYGNTRKYIGIKCI